MNNEFIYLIMLISFILLLIANLMIMMSILISKKKKNNLEKMTPFESGFNSKYKMRIPFSLRFFLITIIFLIFDVEISLMIPLISSFLISNYLIWLLTSMMFMIILMIGLIYEWNQGALNWL